MSGRRRRSRWPAAFAVATALVVGGSGATGVQSASAHHSAYCGHGIATGTHWMTLYGSYTDSVVSKFGSHGWWGHFHYTSHWYRSSPFGLFQYRHDGKKICGLFFGPVPVPTTGASTAAVAGIGPGGDPYRCVLKVQTGGQVYAWFGTDNGCSQDAIWVEPGPPIEDSSSDNESLGCIVCVGAAAAESRSASPPTDPIRLHTDDPQTAVETLRATGFKVDVYSLVRGRKYNIDRSVPAPRASDECLVGIYSAAFGPIDPTDVPKRLAVEVADRTMAREVGHGC